MSRLIDISVIVTAHNRAGLFWHTLNGYKFYAPHDGVELVLVDNWSTDGLESLIEFAAGIFQRVKYIRIEKSKCFMPLHENLVNPSLGFNVGVRQSVGRLIIKTCPESYPLADNISIMRELVGAVKGNVYYFGKAIFSKPRVSAELASGKWYPANEGELLDKIPDAVDFIMVSEKGHRVPYPYFACLARNVYDSVNGIDERFMLGWGSEDDDFSVRVHNSGVNWVWSDKCQVLHLWHDRVLRSKSDVERNFALYQKHQKDKIVKVNMDYPYGPDSVIDKIRIIEDPACGVSNAR